MNVDGHYFYFRSGQEVQESKTLSQLAIPVQNNTYLHDLHLCSDVPTTVNIIVPLLSIYSSIFH